MKKIILTLLFSAACAVVTSVPAQTPTSESRPVSPSEYETLRRTGQVSTSADREQALVQNKARLEKAKKQIAPSAVENQYKSFLRQPKTGIVRLVLAKKCDLNAENGINQDKLAKECPTEYLPGGGSNFSFRKNEYFYASFSDISIKDSLIFSDTAFAQNIMVRLGDIPLEQVSLASEGVKFLSDFVPASVATDADKQIAQFNKGLQNDKYTYARGFKIAVNTTFALRVIPYQGEVEPQLQLFLSLERQKRDSRLRIPTFNVSNTNKDSSLDSFKKNSDPLYSDLREDIIVAFRIVEQAEDGSVTLLWRELRRAEAPKIALK